MGFDEGPVGCLSTGDIMLTRWEETDEIAHGGDHIGFIESADQSDLITDPRHDPFRITGEQIGGIRVGPPTPGCHPARRREVVEGHDRFQSSLPTGGDHSFVVR